MQATTSARSEDEWRLLPPFDPQEPVRMTDHVDQSRGGRHRLNQYIRGEQIGGGYKQNGEVYACHDESLRGYPLAVKAIRRFTQRDRTNLLRQRVAEDDNTVWSTRREIAIMKRCRHANVVRLVEVIDDPNMDKIFIIMEYLAGGPIQWQTPDKTKPLLTLTQSRRVMRDAILGLEYLHSEGIIHRDIKPSNLLYTRDRRTVKIIDFGVAHFIPTPRIKARPSRPDIDIDPELFPPRNLTRTQGTPFFMAPEVVVEKNTEGMNEMWQSYDTISTSITDGNRPSSGKRRPPITSAVDIWALGVTLYCLLFGHIPFEKVGLINLYNDIQTGDFNVDKTMGFERVPTGGRHPRDPSSEGAIVINLLERMLEKDPKRRMTLASIKEHPWILYDVMNPKEWIKLTSPISESEEETREETKTTWVKTAGKKLFGKLMTGRT